MVYPDSLLSSSSLYSFPTMVEMFKTIYDYTDDELEALKRFLPDWSKNSTILPMKDEEGNLKYIDFSHGFAYDTVTRPVQTVLNMVAQGETDEKTLMEGFMKGLATSTSELGAPFISESIWTEALADVMVRGGKSREGFEIYDWENDTKGDVAEKIFIHLLKSQMPGSIIHLGRIDYAITGFDTPLQTGDLGGRFKWGKIGKYDEIKMDDFISQSYLGRGSKLKDN